MGEDWTLVTLAEICEKPQYGAIASGSDVPVGPLFVRQTDIVSGEIDWASVPFAAVEDRDRSKYALSVGDLLISRLGAGVGTAARVRQDRGAIFAGYLVRFRVRTALADSAFVGHALHSSAWAEHVAGVRSGAAQPTLNAQQMGEFRFLLPSLPEQRRIAGVLGAFEDLIDSIRQEHGRLVELAKSVLQQSARHEKTFARVGDVADVLRGLSYKGSGLSDSGTPMVNMGSAENFGWLKRSGWKFYSGDFKPRHLAGARDLILVNTEQTWRQEILGWPLLVPSDVQEALFSHHTYRVAFKPSTEWMKLPLWAHLFTAEARSWIDGAVRGTTVANLPTDAVENLTFLVPVQLDPSLEAAEALLELAWASERQVEHLQASRDELLPLLMSGRVTVDEAWEAVPA